MADDVDLIAAIYDAIIDPSRWEEVVKRIVEATKSVSGGLLVLERNAAHLSATHNVDRFYANAYVEHWHQHNPLRAVEATVSPGELKTATHLFETETFRASAFFNEFLCPQGWADVVGVGLLRGPNSSGHLLVHRSPDAIWVEPKEWRLLETLAPHLKRAAEVHQLLARERAAKESLGAGVAAAGFAVFLLTKDCRVNFANAKAEDLVRRGVGLRYENERLAAATQTLTQCLHALAREAAQPDRAETDIGGTVELPCGENRPPLLAHVIPLAANRTVSIFDIERPAAAVFVVDPSSDFAAQIRRFGARFGLTPAETRVVGEIIGGNGLLAAAASLKITEDTARTHAKRIFSKTGTNRQTELIRRFFQTTWTLLKSFPIWVSSSSLVRDGLETVGCEGSLDFSMLMIACGG
jgi:DNA-binding CsgD family transcriptional regulator